MSKKQKISAAALVVGAAMLGAASSAQAFSLGGYQGPINVKFSGYTTEFNTAGGNETTWGAGFLTTIHEFGNPANVLWSNSGSEQIGYMIYGIADASITGTGPYDIYNVGCVGGSCDGKIHLDLYLNPTGGSFSDTTAAGLSIGDRGPWDTMAGITDGISLAKFVMVPGIQGVDDVGTLFDEISADMVQHVSATTLPATGDGNFYADCVAGSGALCDMMDTDMLPVSNPYNPSSTADILGKFTLSPVAATTPFGGPNGLWTNGWRGDTFDPITGFVPEPGVIGLMGAGLVSLAGFARRRKTQA